MYLKKWKFFIIFIFVIEFFSISILHHYFPYLNPFLVFISGLTIGVMMVMISFDNSISDYFLAFHKKSHRQKIHLSSLILLVLAVLSIFIFRNSFDFNIVKNSELDTIQLLVQRFINGETVYKSTPEQIFPNFLPLQWAPFLIAEIFHLDYRIFSFLIFVFGVFIFQNGILASNLKIQYKQILALLPIIVILLTFYTNQSIITNTLSPMVLGFFLVLSVSIFSKSRFTKAIGIVLALFSKFGLIFWLPLYLLSILMKKKRDFITIMILVISSGFLMLFPLLKNEGNIIQKTFESSVQLQKKYLASEKGHSNLGIAPLILKANGQSQEDFISNIQFPIMLVLSIIGIILFLVKYGHFHANLFLLGFLKLNFVFYYSFNPTPFFNYFLLSIIFSILILFQVLKMDKDNRNLVRQEEINP